MLTAGFRWAPDTLPMNRMIAITISPGATTAAVRLIVSGNACPIIPPPAATSTRKNVPRSSEKSLRHSWPRILQNPLRKSTTSRSRCASTRDSPGCVCGSTIKRFLPRVLDERTEAVRGDTGSLTASTRVGASSSRLNARPATGRSRVQRLHGPRRDDWVSGGLRCRRVTREPLALDGRVACGASASAPLTLRATCRALAMPLGRHRFSRLDEKRTFSGRGDPVRQTPRIERSSQPHLDAARRHDAAAATHERSAIFWDQQGDVDRAALQRELAQHERHGAELERRWAALVERDRRSSG